MKPFGWFILALLFAMLAPFLVADERLDDLVTELTESEQPQARTAEQWRTDYAYVLDGLLLDMGADDLAARETPQKTFERIGFLAGRPGADIEREALCRVMIDRIGPDTSQPARLWLLRQLALLAGAESVPALLQTMADPDPLIRDWARRALQKDSAPEAAAALRTALDQATDASWRVALINALAARHDRASVPTMIALTGNDAATVAAAAISALGEIGDAQVYPTLRALWRDAPTQRTVTAAALLHLAERMAASNELPAAVRIYDELKSPDAPLHVQLAAWRGLASARGAELLPALIDLIVNDQATSQLRTLASTLIAAHCDAVAGSVLVERVASASAASQALILRTLAACTDPAVTTLAATTAETALTSTSEEVRLAALHTLRETGGAHCLLPVARIATTGSDAEHTAAAHTLARLRGPTIDQAIIDALDSADADLHAPLIRALAARYCRTAVPALCHAAQTAGTETRPVAWEALGALARPDDLPALLALLPGTDTDSIRQAAVDALVAVCQRIPDTAERAAPILAAWDGATDATQVLLVNALGRVGGPAALTRIRAARQMDDVALIDATVRALARWPEIDVLDDLLDIAQNSGSKTHRVLALQGYARLLELPSERDLQGTVDLYHGALYIAERPEEERLLLAGLAKVNDLNALRLIESHLTDESLRAEAEAAVLASARLLAPTERKAARAAVEAIVAQTTSDQTRDAAQQTLDAMRQSEGYLVAWQAAGPYTVEGLDWTRLHDQPFAPETDERADTRWHTLPITNTNEPWNFDLHALDPGDLRCAYLRCQVWSDAAQDVQLQVGSDDSLKVWLNGNLVHEYRDIRGLTPFEDHVSITLQQGWNRLLLKVVQATGGWGFTCGLRTPDGAPLEGLRCRAE